MLIAFEGVDGSGKSSLARDVANEIRRQRPNDKIIELHCGPLKRDPLDEYLYSIENYQPHSGQHILIDRWHYGEEVYGPLYRGGSAIRPSLWRWLDLWLQSRGMRVWEVTNSPLEIRTRLEQRGEDFLQPADIEYVIGKFHSIATGASTYADTVAVEGDTSLLVKRIIVDAAYAEASSDVFMSRSTSYVGRTFADPRILLVGDKRGGRPPFKTQSAFFPMNGNSASFLWNALPNDLWSTVGAVNINDDENGNLPALVEWLEDSAVIALGREAQKTLKELSIPHSVVPHPQAVRRFNNSKIVEYGTLIRQASKERKDYGAWPK